MHQKDQYSAEHHNIKGKPKKYVKGCIMDLPCNSGFPNESSKQLTPHAGLWRTDAERDGNIWQKLVPNNKTSSKQPEPNKNVAKFTFILNMLVLIQLHI